MSLQVSRFDGAAELIAAGAHLDFSDSDLLGRAEDAGRLSEGFPPFGYFLQTGPGQLTVGARAVAICLFFVTADR